MSGGFYYTGRPELEDALLLVIDEFEFTRGDVLSAAAILNDTTRGTPEQIIARLRGYAAQAKADGYTCLERYVHEREPKL